MNRSTLLITQEEIEQALTLSEYVPIIEKVHADHARKQVYRPNLLHADVREGEFHLKTGGIIDADREYFGVKMNGGFFRNAENYGLPNILGIIYICDARNGYPLAIMDSTVISRLRTGAATAVAAKYLAPRSGIRLGVVGYGAQAEIQIKAVSTVCRIQEIRISGRNPEKAKAFAEKMQKVLSIPVCFDLLENTSRKSNFLITTTPAREYYIQKEWITPGTFIAAIGADSPGKQELAPELMAASTIVADIKEQVCRVGESQHAIAQGLISPNDIYAELGEIVTTRKQCPVQGKTIVYDSTGTALQDISVGVSIYEKLREGGGKRVELFQ